MGPEGLEPSIKGRVVVLGRQRELKTVENQGIMALWIQIEKWSGRNYNYG